MADVNFIKTDVLIVGDFNINYNQRHSRGYRLLKAFERETGVKQLVTNDTRTSSKFLSRIDLILTNMKDITKVFVCNNLISDHLPIAIIKKHKIAQKIQKWVTGRQYKNYDMDRFERTLNRCDWTEFYCTTNPDALWQIMKATIEQL